MEAERVDRHDDVHAPGAVVQGSRTESSQAETTVRDAIERGLADSDAGRIQTVDEVRSRYGLST
jgi:predicted transcriptional regulator